MGVKIKNNAFGVLLISINTSATSITLQTGQGANFPSLSAGDYFYATLIDTSNNLEIVKVTARTGDVLTVVRAQEGTTARSYAVGDRIELRLTAQNVLDMLADGSLIGAGTIPGTALADLAVSTAKLADGAVTTAKVADANITQAKMASDAPLGLKSVQVFTSTGASTWTRPSGIRKVRVYVTGAGGGGGSHNGDDAQGGGGGGGTAIKLIDVTSISSVTVTVGSGGSASSGNNSSGGTSGGTSSFGTHCSATGGAPPVTWGIGGYGGGASGGDINLPGGDGGTGNIDGYGNEEAGGSGGSTFWGGGPAGGSYWYARYDARVYGVGGAGAHAQTSNAGGAGMSGVVVVEEYA